MPSPFPGMDPYIEASRLWEDFHHDLISEIKHALASRLPERYVVRAGERSYVALAVENEDQTRSFQPDVAVASRPGRFRRKRKPQQDSDQLGLQTASGPVMMQAAVREEYREGFLEIRETDAGHKLVTGIEILSPSNKRPRTKGWRLYNRKRFAYVSGYANFVELDLLRGGQRMPMVNPWPDSPYYLLVCRKEAAPRCAVYPVYFTEPLPTIPIPLIPPDPDIPLDIQPMLATIYARSRYDHDIDYRGPLDPPLGRSEAAWLEERLSKWGKPS
jgi:Protein of unknown function (DUF4058)